MSDRSNQPTGGQGGQQPQGNQGGGGFGNRSNQPTGGQGGQQPQGNQGGGGFGNRSNQPTGGQGGQQPQGNQGGGGFGNRSNQPTGGQGGQQPQGNQGGGGFGNRSNQPTGGQGGQQPQGNQGGGGFGNRSNQPTGGQGGQQPQGNQGGGGFGNRSNQPSGNQGNNQGNRSGQGGFNQGQGGHNPSNSDSNNMVQRWNRERSGSGVNSRPLPQGNVSQQNGGSYSLRTNSGREYNVRPDGGVSSYRGPNNTEARFRNDGSVREVHRQGMTVYHGPANVRRVVVERPDRSVIVTNHHGFGYVQRPVAFRNQSFVARTFYRNNAASVRFYRPYAWHGVTLNMYAPMRYHAAPFYSWAYSPWRSPVAYRWGWFGAPWYAYYGGYFTPYVSYSSPVFWLTDYLFATTLETAYRDRVEGGPVSQAAVTHEVKLMVADEVRRQLQWEQAEGDAALRNASYDSGLPRLLSDGAPHAFVVSDYLEVDAGGYDCSLTPGDVIRLDNPPPPDGSSAWLRVITSKYRDCRPGTSVAVGFGDLQEMYNSMRDTVDAGLADLRSRQGREGLPPAPAAAMQGTWDAPYANSVSVDPNGAGELMQQARYADSAEQEVVSQAFAQEAVPPGPVQPSYSNAPPAVVWVFRTKGNVFRPSVFVNGMELVRLGGGRRIKLVLPAGPAEFQLDNLRAEVLPMDLRPGAGVLSGGSFFIGTQGLSGMDASGARRTGDPRPGAGRGAVDPASRHCDCAVASSKDSI